jgi:hypothetical protein
MKYLLGMFIIILADISYAQDPLIEGNDYPQSSVKCPKNKFSSGNDLKDMNYTMDMNNPLYMENGTLGDQNFNRNSDFNSNPDNFYSRDMNILTSENQDQCMVQENGTLNEGQKSKKGINKGMDKIKHNKITKHLFNQPS